MDWNQIAQTALTQYVVPIAALLISALVARYLIPWLRKKEMEADTSLKKIAIGLAISAVEQQNDKWKKQGSGVQTGAEKRDDAITMAAKTLGNYNLKMSPDEIGDMIESVLGETKIKNDTKKE